VRLYAWYVVGLLTIANSLAFVDRQILALLVEPIRQDLGASDTTMSLLYGLSFALFYVAVGLPIARLADRSNRRNIIALSIIAWSAMTALCGLARSFTMLFMARIGVGAGEAGLTPSVHSLLADYFPPHKRALPFGIYAMGIYIGGGLALIIGGFVIAALNRAGPLHLPLIGLVKPWQAAFIIVGLPGLLLGPLAFTIREPLRQGAVGKPAPLPFAAMWAHVGPRRWSYCGIIVGLALMILVGNGTGAWIPAFFSRKFGWGPQEIGLRYGLVVFSCGIAGALCGGLFASLLRRRGVLRANLWSAMLGFAVLVPVTVLFPLMPTPQLALLLIGVMNFFAGFPFGGGYAALQEITPATMRAQMAAVMLLANSLIGAGLGPTLVALVTDRVFADPAALPQSISLVSAIVSPLAVLMLGIALLRHPAAMLERESAR
jgi:MFS family permease